MTVPLLSHVRFQRRLLRMKQLYDFTMHAYLVLASDLEAQVAAGTLSMDSHISSSFGLFKKRIVRQIVGHSVGLYPEMMRSTLLVRLVTQLEVFLTDALLEIAKRDFAPFMDATRLDLERREVGAKDTLEELIMSEVAKDVRTLTSGGFEKIRTYYKRHFALEIVPAGTELKTVRELHTRRHLHVHRGGYADAQYKHDFASPLDVGEYLPVSDQYLQDSFDVATMVALHVAERLDALHPVRPSRAFRGNKSTIGADDYVYSIRALFPSDAAALAHFALERSLNKRPHTEMREILLNATLEERAGTWVIAGPKSIIGAYVGDLHKQHIAGELKAFSCIRIQPG